MRCSSRRRLQILAEDCERGGGDVFAWAGQLGKDFKEIRQNVGLYNYFHLCALCLFEEVVDAEQFNFMTLNSQKRCIFEGAERPSISVSNKGENFVGPSLSPPFPEESIDAGHRIDWDNRVGAIYKKGAPEFRRFCILCSVQEVSRDFVSVVCAQK